jgi:hypothetical protein
MLGFARPPGVRGQRERGAMWARRSGRAAVRAPDGRVPLATRGADRAVDEPPPPQPPASAMTADITSGQTDARGALFGEVTRHPPRRRSSVLERSTPGTSWHERGWLSGLPTGRANRLVCARLGSRAGSVPLDRRAWKAESAISPRALGTTPLVACTHPCRRAVGSRGLWSRSSRWPASGLSPSRWRASHAGRSGAGAG